MALSGTLVDLGTLVAIYGLLAIGLNVKFGYTGLLDIGHVAFFLLGAYTTTLLVLPPSEQQQFGDYILGLNWGSALAELTGLEFATGVGWLAAILVAAVVAGAAGMLIALPAIRLREDYLAIAVLGISVIIKRIFQTETWLANGPDALKGWSDPLTGLIPLPGTGLESAVLLGLVVFAFWTIGASVVAGLQRRATGNPHGRMVDGLLAVTTLGVGYLAATRSYTDGRYDWRPAAAGGVVAGAAATGLALAGLGSIAVFVFFGAASLFAWVVALVMLADHYDEVPARDVLTGLGMAIAFVVAFVPLIVLGGGGGDISSTVGMLLTVLLLGAFFYGLYYLANEWARFGHGAPFVSVVGVAAAWLFVIRYFVLETADALAGGGVGTAVRDLLQNILWLVNFAPAGAEFGYARFLFLLAVATLAVAYYVAEVTAQSPFGRVLRAIREDEDVATALGKDTFSYKVQSMILGSAIAGVAGGLFAIYLGAIQHVTFAPRVTFIVFLMVIIGGTANNRGVILGAAIYWAFQKGTQDIAAFFPTAVRSQVQALRLAFIGALLIVILYYRPEGIWGEKSLVTAGGEE